MSRNRQDATDDWSQVSAKALLIGRDWLAPLSDERAGQYWRRGGREFADNPRDAAAPWPQGRQGE
ncbi:MAG TPA: hypothetical protein VGP93_12950 [Polyangiaceae bacterium]|nr:hypothetical protein [Polyangiaceae bacterium]